MNSSGCCKISGTRQLPFIIYEDGEVYPCEILQTGYGNIRNFDYDVSKILNTEKAKEINTFIKDKKCHCSFECTLPLSIIFNPRGWYWLFKKYLRYLRLKLQEGK